MAPKEKLLLQDHYTGKRGNKGQLNTTHGLEQDQASRFVYVEYNFI